MMIDGETSKTCPQYFARSPFVLSVRDQLEDYRRGALGDVRDLPAHLLAYLRVLDSADTRWQRQQEATLHKQVKSKRHGA